jgi:succinyl-CoA synthetase beta subunit
MKIHEYQAREILRTYGIPTSTGPTTDQLDQVKALATQVGFPVVVKAQVHVGGRGKAGGVKLANNAEETYEKSKAILGMNLKGTIVKKILISKAADIKKEFYLGAIVDRASSSITFMLSAAGGVEIENVAAETPELIHYLRVPYQKEVALDEAKAYVAKVFSEPAHIQTAAEVMQKLYRIFIDKDCSLAEINPFIIDGNNQLLAIDAKMNFDDNALFRHPDIASLQDLNEEDADEVEAKVKNLSFVKLDGDIGCMVNGAGLAMATMDVIKNYGGQPANFLDVGGSSNPQKVVDALNIIMRNPQIKGVLINIFGGITRCDDIANGLLTALDQINIPVPMVVRLTGTNEKEAKEILKNSKKDLNPSDSMAEAVEKIVALTR